ncbi:MAG: hypothetical protein M1824_003383 [Vezdaea acicularis]|nr:MAG: hypothetical protein M1824_003383 [Vezdaea acicularis]
MSTINRYLTQTMPHPEVKFDNGMEMRSMPAEEVNEAEIGHEPVSCRKRPDKAKRQEKAARRFQENLRKKAAKKAEAEDNIKAGENEQDFGLGATMEANSIEKSAIVEENNNEENDEEKRLWERSHVIVRAILQDHDGFDTILHSIGADRRQYEKIVGAQSVGHMARILIAENIVPSAADMLEYLQLEPMPIPVRSARRPSSSATSMWPEPIPVPIRSTQRLSPPQASIWSFAIHYSNDIQRQELLELLEAPEGMREALLASSDLEDIRDMIDDSQIFIRREDEYWIGELVRAGTSERRRQLLDERGAPAEIYDAVLDTVDARWIIAILTLSGLTKLGGENPAHDLVDLAQEALDLTEETCISRRLPSLDTSPNTQPQSHIWLETLLDADTAYERRYILDRLGASRSIREAILHSDRQKIELIAIGSGLIAPCVEVVPEPILDTLVDFEAPHNIWVEIFMAGSEGMRRDMLKSRCTSDSTVEDELAISDRDLVEAISAGYSLFANPDSLECKPKGLGANQPHSDADDSEGSSTNGHDTPTKHSGCSSPATNSSLSSLTSLEDEAFGLAPFFVDEQPSDCIISTKSSTYDARSDYDEWVIRLIEEYEDLEMALGLDEDKVFRQDEELETFPDLFDATELAPNPSHPRCKDTRENGDEFDIGTLSWLQMAQLTELPRPSFGEDALLA